MAMLQYVHVMHLLLKLFQLSVCFEMQLKVLVKTYNALPGIGTAYLLWCHPDLFI